MYSLSTSMTDRANFDEMVRSYLSEVKFIGTPAEAVELFCFEEGATEDDVEEAKARIEALAKIIILENFADKLEEIEGEGAEGAIVVFDTGCEIFGQYANGVEAAEAVRNSNPDWWAMQEAPTYEFCDNCDYELNHR